ncbi:hypothetical protein D6853_08565 [Butyrivibrio sp. X503]|uniref:hypothetical protein n=1 Tax=Butyrivibrio sp. X503 TaxID=2364878 RepID=UPI000EA8B1E4|nr:hypothetical protein [Butyrivibrio sp. X503]RKM55598.1 hypothetical protein D6853_08565 [Butyrivibrio sp. X503]
MKTKTTMAILTASAMMLALMGCGDSVGSASAFEGISAEETTSPTETDTTDAAESPAKATPSDITDADASFEYNGQSVSIFDDDKTIHDVFGEEIPDYTYSDDKNVTHCSFGTKEDSVGYSVWDNNGEKYPLTLTVCDKNVKTSKGIGIGNTKDEVIAAYGDSYTVAPNMEDGIIYDFGSFTMDFCFFDGELYLITFWNTENNNKAPQ